MTTELRRRIESIVGRPWEGEPDRVEWRAHGMPCLIQRSHMGNLCGYVAVSRRHPLYRKDYSAPACAGIEVHGGLTYAGHCHGKICHAPKPGEPDDVWWFGFDCAHWGDLVPSFEACGRVLGYGTYKGIAYVRREVVSLAAQLGAIQSRRHFNKGLASRVRGERKRLVRLAGAHNRPFEFTWVGAELSELPGVRIPRSLRSRA